MADSQTLRTLRKLGGQFALLASVRDKEPEYIARRLSVPIETVERIFLGKINDVPLAAVLGIAEMIGGRLSLDLQMLSDEEYARNSDTGMMSMQPMPVSAPPVSPQPEFLSAPAAPKAPSLAPAPDSSAPRPTASIITPTSRFPEKRTSAMEALASASCPI